MLEHLLLLLVIWSIFIILQLTIQKKDSPYNVHVSGRKKCKGMTHVIYWQLKIHLPFHVLLKALLTTIILFVRDDTSSSPWLWNICCFFKTLSANSVSLLELTVEVINIEIAVRSSNKRLYKNTHISFLTLAFTSDLTVNSTQLLLDYLFNTYLKNVFYTPA